MAVDSVPVDCRRSKITNRRYVRQSLSSKTIVFITGHSLRNILQKMCMMRMLGGLRRKFLYRQTCSQVISLKLCNPTSVPTFKSLHFCKEPGVGGPVIFPVSASDRSRGSPSPNFTFRSAAINFLISHFTCVDT